MKVYTTGQVSTICQVATSTVHKWFDKGKLKGFRIPGSRHRRIPRDNLIEFLQEHGFPTDAIDKVALVFTHDATVADALAQALRDLEFDEVIVAFTSLDAGMQMEGKSCWCAIIDWADGANGRAAQSVLEQLKVQPIKPVIILLEDKSSVDNLIADYDDVFVKPYDPIHVAARAKRLISS